MPSTADIAPGGAACWGGVLELRQARRDAAECALAARAMGFAERSIVEAIGASDSTAEAMTLLTGLAGLPGPPRALRPDPGPRTAGGAPVDAATQLGCGRALVGPLRPHPCCSSPGCGRAARRSGGAFAATCCSQCPDGHIRRCRQRHCLRDRAGIVEGPAETEVALRIFYRMESQQLDSDDDEHLEAESSQGARRP